MKFSRSRLLGSTENLEKGLKDRPCKDQANFNDAIQEALDEYEREVDTDLLIVAIVFYSLFLIWAVVLAVNKAKKGLGSQIDMMFAFLAPPIYVISYYIEVLAKKTGKPRSLTSRS